MSRDGSTPEEKRGRTVGPAGKMSFSGKLSAWLLRGGQLLPDGAVSGPVHPLLRLFSRWVRRPLLPALRLWRRNIQLRVVATTLLMSLAVVLLLGVVVVGQVRNGLLTAKAQAAQSQAVGGFGVAQKLADGADADGTRPDEGARTGNRGNQDSATWLTSLVEQLASGGQGVFSVVALSSDSEEPFGDSSRGTRGPRASGDVDPERSVPADLRRKLDAKAGTFRQYTEIKRIGSDDGVPALIIGKRLNDVNSNQYQLYYLFPFSQEAESLKLVTGPSRRPASSS